MCTIHTLHTCRWYFLSFLMHGISCTVCLLLKDTQSCEEIVRHHQTQYKWDQLLHNLHHCSQTLMGTIHIHTCFSCKWYFMNFLRCAFSSTVCLLLKDMGKLLLGKEKSESRIAQAL